METITMNATATGLTGITNLASQSGTLGTVFGATLLVGLILGVFGSAHSWNTKGWLYRAVMWLLANVGENVVYGIATYITATGIYYVGSEISKFGGNNPHFLSDMAYLFCGIIVVVAALTLIGWVSKPVWNWMFEYAQGNTGRKVKR